MQHSTIEISREPDQRIPGQDEWVESVSYASLRDDTLLRSVSTGKENVIQRSDDGGRSWRTAETVARRVRLDERRAHVSSGILWLDDASGRLIRLISDGMDTAREHTIVYANGRDIGPRTFRLFYQLSSDGGRTWTPKRQIVEKGPEFDETHWANGVYHGRSSIVPAWTQFRRLKDGTIVIPGYRWATDEEIRRRFDEENRPEELRNDSRYYMQALCLAGRWRADGAGLEWTTGEPILTPGGYTSAGTCGTDEPAIAALGNDRFFAVVRTATSHRKTFAERNIPILRYCALSEDGCRTWRDVRPLTYSDGATLYAASSAYSEFIRVGGKWHWVGNILQSPCYGDCDPRYPLVMGELDERTLGIKRETIKVIADREPGDVDYVRFSNFRVYEERGTGDTILLLTKTFADVPDVEWWNIPRTSYRFRIRAK